jgi:RNA polymerase sigma-70 factor (ECF subfamily)
LTDTEKSHALTTEEEGSLILQAQADPRAFGPLYEKYYKRIFLFVLRRVGEKDYAADLTQQVFVKALDNLRKFKFRGLPFSSWLFRVAINECHESFRKSKRIRVVTLEDVSLENLHEELVASNSREDLERKIPFMLQRLKSFELTLIELRFFEHRSFREIGELTNTTELLAKVRTYRTLDKLKKFFLDEHRSK